MSFETEYRNNLSLVESPFVVKMSEFVEEKSEKPHFTVNGQPIRKYSYLTLPYCPNGSLIDLLIKANKKQQKLSLDLKLYLIKTMV